MLDGYGSRARRVTPHGNDDLGNDDQRAGNPAPATMTPIARVVAGRAAPPTVKDTVAVSDRHPGRILDGHDDRRIR
jgi:hypothetical protein